MQHSNERCLVHCKGFVGCRLAWLQLHMRGLLADALDQEQHQHQHQHLDDVQVRELQATNEQLSGALSHKTAEADSLRELAEAVQQQQAATLQARKIMELSRKVRATCTLLKSVVSCHLLC